MSYQTLARRYRPRRFADLRGQEPVVRALRHALDGDNLHPALLLTGTRGVGKTTLGRIIAKCLNCEQGVSAEPCEACSACREVDEGRFMDLIEIDAASRTKVEDTRQLLDNVAYAPARGRYKVYLIDEVHMLSTSSFNALLKTLEEPPPHVKFILATTDPQKLPVTVLSRCLKFNLRRLPVSLIREVLGEVLEQEKLEADSAALAALAQAADGSMRDGLSLLDQAIAYANGARLERDAMETMLGTVGRRGLLELLAAVDAGDGKTLLAGLDDLASLAPDYAALLDMLAGDLQRISTVQVLPDAAGDEDDPRLLELAQTLAAEDVQVNYDIAVHARRDLRWAPAPRVGFEMALLRMFAFRPETQRTGKTSQPGNTRTAPPASARAEPESPPGKVDEAASVQTVPPEPKPGADSAPVQAPPAATGPAVAAPAGDDTTNAADAATQSAWDASATWPEQVQRLGLAGLGRELARHCALAGGDDDTLQLTLDVAHEHLLVDTRRAEIEQALAAASGCRRRVEITVGELVGDTPARAEERAAEGRQAQAEAALEGSAAVRALRATFDATLRPGSVRPASAAKH